MTYTCTALDDDQHTVVTVTGDIDFATSEPLWEDLDTRLTPAKSVIIDCSGITFLDSMGLRALLQAKDRARELDIPLTLAAPSGPVSRVLELAGVSALFSISNAAV